MASAACLSFVPGLTERAQGAGTTIMPARNVQTMVYEVYAGGIDAVKAELTVGLESKDRYSVVFNAETTGFLGNLVPWSGVFETHGWRLKDGANAPEQHKTTSIWRGEADSHEYKYKKDGTFVGMKSIVEGEDVTPKDLTPELTDGTTDILTATLAVMEKIAENGACEGSSEVFDGARRFELVFLHEADEDMTATKYNAYQGPAVRCTTEVKPVAGKWHLKPRGWMSIQEQGRKKGTMPTVWMAKIDAKGPAVPVKVRVKTDYGTLFMHLVGYKNGERSIMAAAEE